MKKKKPLSNQSTSYNIPIKFIFVGMLSACNGWSVGNFQDSAFVELIDQDSTSHYYDADILFYKDSWCYTHNQWEVIKKK